MLSIHHGHLGKEVQVPLSSVCSDHFSIHQLQSLFSSRWRVLYTAVITLAISEFAVPAVVLFVLYAADVLRQTIVLDHYVSTTLAAGCYFDSLPFR